MGKPDKKNPSETVSNPPPNTDAAQQWLQYLSTLSPALTKLAGSKSSADLASTAKMNKLLLRLTAGSAKVLGNANFKNEANLAPKYADLYTNILDQTDPQFRTVRNKLGAQVSGDLDNGYDIGDDLSREIEQDVRGGQDARGNWFGPAPTADEAFRKASARLAMYRDRQGAAQSFLSGPSATDKMGSIRSATASTQFFNPSPQNSAFDPNTIMNLTGQQSNNQQNYFQNLLQATNQRNNATSTDYDAYLKRYGILNPSAGYAGGGGGGSSSGGGWGQAAGVVGGGIAAGVATTAGLVAAGAGTATAGGLGLASAASAAVGAAVCWVARSVYGESDPRWRRFRTWLLLEAPKWLKRAYIRHGEKFAQWLDSRGVWLKPALRGAMNLVTA